MAVKNEYRFIPGNGDPSHEAEITAAGQAGWKVIQMEFDPDATGANKRLVVLLEKSI